MKGDSSTLVVNIKYNMKRMEHLLNRCSDESIYSVLETLLTAGIVRRYSHRTRLEVQPFRRELRGELNALIGLSNESKQLNGDKIS